MWCDLEYFIPYKNPILCVLLQFICHDVQSAAVSSELLRRNFTFGLSKFKWKYLKSIFLHFFRKTQKNANFCFGWAKFYIVEFINLLMTTKVDKIINMRIETFLLSYHSVLFIKNAGSLPMIYRTLEFKFNKSFSLTSIYSWVYRQF